MLLAAILPETRPSLYRRTLSSAPVKFLGTISYGLYMMHILVFVVIGTFEHWVRPYGTTVSNLAIVTARLLLSVGAATLLWNGFEKPILRLKSRFESPAQPAPAGETAPGNLLAKTASAD
jgi:peptidoglycan/LPS O-acetylase OafA/YrhL